MEKILFLAHTQADGTLPNVAREALSAAVDLSGSLPVLPLLSVSSAGRSKPLPTAWRHAARPAFWRFPGRISLIPATLPMSRQSRRWCVNPGPPLFWRRPPPGSPAPSPALSSACRDASKPMSAAWKRSTEHCGSSAGTTGSGWWRR